ncbi:CPBP family intramembrane glutamic endopeptidase [Geothrix campi]|uniref:CPBP family intramembrane glutamic endopeptidase n=1 Tax=Geothrix campi TaxID=2966450 RepID=UPI002147F006|nr:type II CAAX endopeptidase family protein [Geothrix sp. SG10]
MPEAEEAAVPGPGTDRVNRAFAGVGAALGLFVWLNLFPLPLVIASGIASKSHAHLGFLLGFLAMLTVVPGVLWVAKSAWGEHWRRALPLAPVGPGVLAWTVLGVLALLPVVMAWTWAIDRTVGLPSFRDPLASVGVLGVVLGAPIAEEVLFRGYGLARIRELGGERRALLLTALVFALAHGSWVKLPGTFVIGLLLGWLVLRTGSLWPAFLGHFTNNGAALVLGRLNPMPSFDPAKGSWTAILLVGAAGLAGLAILWSPQVRGRIRGLNAST